MFETFTQNLSAWNNKSSDRAKLQQTYLVSAVALLLVAGVIGLINHELGQTILLVAIMCAGLFLVNAVVWSLLQSAVLSRLSKRPAAISRKK